MGDADEAKDTGTPDGAGEPGGPTPPGPPTQPVRPATPYAPWAAPTPVAPAAQPAPPAWQGAPPPATGPIPMAPPGQAGYPPPGAAPYPAPAGHPPAGTYPAGTYPPPAPGRSAKVPVLAVVLVAVVVVLVLLVGVAVLLVGRGGGTDEARPGTTPSVAPLAGTTPSSAVTIPGTCDSASVGETLRGRTSQAGDALTVTAGAVSCPADVPVVLRAAELDLLPPDPVSGTYALPQTLPTFTLGDYTRTTDLTVTPSPPGTCKAAVVYVEVPEPSAVTNVFGGPELGTPVLDLLRLRTPAKDGETILWTGSASPILAVVTGPVGDDCDPALSVDAPKAERGDCWLEATGTRTFTKTKCTAKHSAEVLYTKQQSIRDWRAAHKGKPDPSQSAYRAWMKGRAQKICAPKFGAVPLRSGVKIKDLTATYIYPSTWSTLDVVKVNDPDPPASQQVVCLIRFKDEKRTTTRKLLAV